MENDRLNLPPGEIAADPAAMRRLIRAGEFAHPTAGLAAGYVQCNVVILPAAEADLFAEYCRSNPEVSPLLARSKPGEYAISKLGRGLDIRTDIGKYNVFRGQQTVIEVPDIMDIWRDDLVTFAMGCSFSFEDALRSEGVELRYLSRGEREVLYETTVATKAAGVLKGPLIVSMRPLRPADAIRAITVTSKYPGVHGAPVHIGKPELIGIDMDDPYQTLSDSTVAADEIPVFWACGVTPQLALAEAGFPLAITHASAHMLITDIRLTDLKVD